MTTMSKDAALAHKLGVRDSIADMPPSPIREVSLVGAGVPGVAAFWFGEPDVPTPKFICDAAAKALSEGKTFYNPNRGIPELRQALVEYQSKLYGRAIDPERITVTASGINAIILSMEILVDPGDEVICVTPLWPNISAGIEIMGGAVKRFPLDFARDKWTLDVGKLIAAIGPKTRAVVVNSPSNPTGWMMNSADQKALLEHCRKHGVWIVADEVYARLAYGRPAAPSFVEHAEPDDRVLVVNSFSKPWAMTGWRVGWITHPLGFGKTLETVTEYNVSCATTFAQWGAIAALKGGEDFIAQSVARYQSNRDVVYQRLAGNSRVRIGLPDGAFYAFFSVEGIKDSLSVAKDIVRNAKVGLAPGIAFGPESQGFLRMCYASEPGRLGAALDRLEDFIGKL